MFKHILRCVYIWVDCVADVALVTLLLIQGVMGLKQIRLPYFNQ